ncbi:hypothetical protein FJZ39_04185 [Candidatus Saccharibacteria bacterium]|nr:hypothetical protein [Candidatus Saccharibacteria bacterium]
MKQLRIYIATLGLILIGSVGMALVSPHAPVADAASCDQRLLTIPPWYRGLTTGSDCALVSPDEAGGISAYIWKIVLNVSEIFIQLIGYIAVGFIIYGGFMYMISQGSADGISSAKKIITNALIGLVIVIAATAIVNLVVGGLS